MPLQKKCTKTYSPKLLRGLSMEGSPPENPPPTVIVSTVDNTKKVRSLNELNSLLPNLEALRPRLELALLGEALRLRAAKGDSQEKQLAQEQLLSVAQQVMGNKALAAQIRRYDKGNNVSKKIQIEVVTAGVALMVIALIFYYEMPVIAAGPVIVAMGVIANDIRRTMGNQNFRKKTDKSLSSGMVTSELAAYAKLLRGIEILQQQIAIYNTSPPNTKMVTELQEKQQPLIAKALNSATNLNRGFLLETAFIPAGTASKKVDKIVKARIEDSLKDLEFEDEAVDETEEELDPAAPQKAEK